MNHTWQEKREIEMYLRPHVDSVDPSLRHVDPLVSLPLLRIQGMKFGVNRGLHGQLRR